MSRTRKDWRDEYERPTVSEADAERARMAIRRAIYNVKPEALTASERASVERGRAHVAPRLRHRYV